MNFAAEPSIYTFSPGSMVCNLSMISALLKKNTSLFNRMMVKFPSLNNVTEDLKLVNNTYINPNAKPIEIPINKSVNKIATMVTIKGTN